MKTVPVPSYSQDPWSPLCTRSVWEPNQTHTGLPMDEGTFTGHNKAWPLRRLPAMQRLYSTLYGYNSSFTYVMYIHSTSAQTKSFISPVSPRFPRHLTDWWTDVQAYLGFPQYIRLLIRLGAVGARSLWREVLYRILSKTSRSPVYISSGGTINILCRKLHAKTPPCSDTDIVSCCLQWSHLKRQIKESSM